MARVMGDTMKRLESAMKRRSRLEIIKVVLFVAVILGLGILLLIWLGFIPW